MTSGCENLLSECQNVKTVLDSLFNDFNIYFLQNLIDTRSKITTVKNDLIEQTTILLALNLVFIKKETKTS